MKLLVASQWVQSLTLVESRLLRDGIEYIRLDGDIAAEKKEAAVTRFNESDSLKVMLLSIKVTRRYSVYLIAHSNHLRQGVLAS
jgi:SNF2 family DNA or RNA helicase